VAISFLRRGFDQDWLASAPAPNNSRRLSIGIRPRPIGLAAQTGGMAVKATRAKACGAGWLSAGN